MERYLGKVYRFHGGNWLVSSVSGSNATDTVRLILDWDSANGFKEVPVHVFLSAVEFGLLEEVE